MEKSRGAVSSWRHGTLARKNNMRPDYRFTIEHKRAAWYPAIYRLTCWAQTILWKLGVAWHNSFSNECTPDFNCCAKKKAK